MKAWRSLSALLLCALAVPARSPGAAPPPWKEWQPAAAERFPRFLDAILRQDASEVRRSLDSGMTVDWQTAGDLSPVDLAVATGNDSIALLLIGRSARKSADSWNLAVSLAIRNGSLAVLQAIDRRGAPPGRWDWGNTGDWGSPLGYALSIGASDEVFEFLLARAPEFGSGSPHRLFQALESFENPMTPAQRALRAHRLLDRGITVQWGHGVDGGKDALLRLVDASGDSSLLRRAEIHLEPRERQRVLNERLAYGARTLGGIDTLLARGADPLGAANDGSNCEQESCWNSPLSLRRRAAYGEARFPSFEWQAIARFLAHDPQRIGRQLREPDHLLIAIARRDLAATMLWVRKNGSDFARGQSGTPHSAAHVALALAAETGDAPLTRFLLGLPFGREDRERALARAVLAHAPDVVEALLRSGVDPNLPTQGGNGRIRLIGSLFDAYAGLRPPQSSDTAIARLLLAPAPGDTLRTHLPLGAWAARHRRKHSVLFDYLWRRQPGSLEGDGFSAHIREDPDLLLDTAVLDHVALEGFERSIADAVCAEFGTLNDRTEERVGLPEMARTLARLEALLARSPKLETTLGPRWTCAGGHLDIAFDSRNRRFHPAWRISSPFSDNADFGIHGDHWRPRVTKW